MKAKKKTKRAPARAGGKTHTLTLRLPREAIAIVKAEAKRRGVTEHALYVEIIEIGAKAELAALRAKGLADAALNAVKRPPQ